MDARTKQRVLKLLDRMEPQVLEHAAALFRRVRPKIGKRNSKIDDVHLLCTCVSLVFKTIGSRDVVEVAEVYEAFTNEAFDHRQALSCELACLQAAEWQPILHLLST
jgi:hypothetical protein